LIAAATHRGYAVTAVTDRIDVYGRHERHPAHLRVKVRGHEIGLRISQESDRSDHVPTAKELADKKRYSYTRIPKYDYTPSPRLKIELPGAYEHRQSAWTDGVRYQLEDKVAEILQEIELRSDATERARIAAEERKRQEQIAHEQRVEQAKLKLIEANRAKVLDTQLAHWHKSRQLDEYLDAMEAVVEQIQDPADGVAASEWLAWARTYTATISPLNRALAMPRDPEPTYTALEPYMERQRNPWLA
jgi:hypothetical protein